MTSNEQLSALNMLGVFGLGHNRQPSLPRGGLLIILVPPFQDGSRPDCEAYYPLSDPLYACLNTELCDCPPAACATRRGSIDCVRVGGRFDGRIAGLPPGFAARQYDDETWERNTVRAGSVLRPLSCYAIVTPDGLWHESFEPEQQDIALVGQVSVLQNDRTLGGSTPGLPSSHQVAWRNELEGLFALHGDHWAVGCTVQAQFGVPQKRCTL